MYVEVIIFHELLHVPPNSMIHGEPMERKVIAYVRNQMFPRATRFPKVGRRIVMDFLKLLMAAETNGPASLDEKQLKGYGKILEPALLRAIRYSGD
jgi:hypothetical protein